LQSPRPLLLLLSHLRQPVAVVLQQCCSVQRRAGTFRSTSAVWICS
jgi:hypothetical protein